MAVIQYVCEDERDGVNVLDVQSHYFQCWTLLLPARFLADLANLLFKSPPSYT